MKRLTSISAGLGALALAAACLTATAGTAAAAPADFESSAASRAPAGTEAYGITFGNVLVKFDVNGPRPINRFGAITGLGSGERIVGMDIRPANGGLYAVSNLGGLYQIRLRDQSVRPVASFGMALDGTSFGVDFNPAADALRVVSNTGQNLRYAFATGTLTEDTDLTEPPTAGTKTGVVAAAYTNNDTSDVTGTTLLDLDTATDRLLVQAPANSGTLSSAGSLRRSLGTDASFDIYSALGGNGAARDNAGYAVATQGGARVLLRVNLLTGGTTKVGEFPNGRKVRDFAIRLP